MRFYNREKEIGVFGNLRGNFRVAVTGRRRIGKTRLVEEVYRKNILTLFISAEKAEREIIEDWSKEYKDIPKVNTFRDLFDFLFSQKEDKIIFLDEIQNLLKVNKGFVFDLQRLIDKYNPKLVVSGSLIGLMKKLIENYKSPLFGRFDMIIKLRELDFRTITIICKDLGFDFETAVKLYSVFGGVPKYYELLEKMNRFSLDSFLLEMFVYYPRPLYEEVKTMLKEEFGKEHKTFFSILSAISQGNTRLSDIAGFLGREQTKITKYLHLLREDFELVNREVPVISGNRGIYKINPNLVKFWFSNIWRYQELLEGGQEEKVAEVLKNNINSWFGRGFEGIVYELVKSGSIKLPFVYTKIGRQWGNIPQAESGRNSYEIDIVCFNEKTREILFGECKWEEDLNAEKVVSELRNKSEAVYWNNKNRKEYFAVFAKSFSKKIKEFEGRQVYCFDLGDLEKSI